MKCSAGIIGGRIVEEGFGFGKGINKNESHICDPAYHGKEFDIHYEQDSYRASCNLKKAYHKVNRNFFIPTACVPIPQSTIHEMCGRKGHVKTFSATSQISTWLLFHIMDRYWLSRLLSSLLYRIIRSATSGNWSWYYEHDGQRKRTKYTVPHSTLNNCCGRQRNIPSLLLCKNV